MTAPRLALDTEAFLAEHPDCDREELREALSGNLCRCTGYIQIFEAVEQAAAVMRGERPAAREEATHG